MKRFERFFIDLQGVDSETVKALFPHHAMDMDIVGPPLDLATSPRRLSALRGGASAAPSSAKVYCIGMFAREGGLMALGLMLPAALILQAERGDSGQNSQCARIW